MVRTSSWRSLIVEASEFGSRPIARALSSRECPSSRAQCALLSSPAEVRRSSRRLPDPGVAALVMRPSASSALTIPDPAASVTPSDFDSVRPVMPGC